MLPSFYTPLKICMRNLLYSLYKQYIMYAEKCEDKKVKETLQRVDYILIE